MLACTVSWPPCTWHVVVVLDPIVVLLSLQVYRVYTRLPIEVQPLLELEVLTSLYVQDACGM
jgi:hypothetical protein